MTKQGPDFIIVGAHKSATTSLHDLLSDVDGIFMTKEKEPRYFSLKDDDLDYRGPGDPAAKCNYQSTENYLNLFSPAKNTDLKGESSTLYLYDKRAPKNIHEYNPDTKIIAILREPVARAVSNYNYALMLSREVHDLDQALDKEKTRMNDKWGPFWHYRAKGFYGDQLSRYYELFPRENILVLFYEDFIKNQKQTILEVLGFLGLNIAVEIVISKKKSNKTLIANNLMGKWIIKYRNYLDKLIPGFLRRSYLATSINNLLFTKPPVQAETTLQNLREGYLKDREVLEQLIKKSIKCWD